MRTNGSRSPEQILAEVETVRNEMDSTLSAIERKLTPGQLLDQGLEYARNSGVTEYFSNLGTCVKENPLPVTLVGVGLAWLMATNRSYTPGYRSELSYAGGASAGDIGSSASSMGHRVQDRASEVASGARETMGQARQTLVDAAETARERLGQARQSISETAQSARERFSGTAQSARETWNQTRRRITDTAYSARETVRRGADTAKLQYERARSGYDWMVREQPLAFGAIGLAIGALLAAAAPRTRAEDEWMGETSDRLAERAKEAGREQFETVKQASEPVTEKVKEVVEPLVSETQRASGTEGQTGSETRPGPKMEGI
jgi:ElaB/YqjD/DUF883 family membrane-anchored ribosome-binding protein